MKFTPDEVVHVGTARVPVPLSLGFLWGVATVPTLTHVPDCAGVGAYGQTPRDDDYHPVATPELISKAHKAGMAVVPWTVNDEDTMREQIAAGVDGLITDYPSKGQAVLQEK